MSSAAADLALPDRRRVTAFSYRLPSPHLTQPSRLGATRWWPKPSYRSSPGAAL